MLQSMESQRVRHNWATKQQWTIAYQDPSLSIGFPRQYTGVRCHFLHQGISLNQGSNSSVCIGRWMSHLIHRSHLRSPHSKVMFLNKLMDSQNDSAAALVNWVDWCLLQDISGTGFFQGKEGLLCCWGSSWVIKQTWSPGPSKATMKCREQLPLLYL